MSAEMIPGGEYRITTVYSSKLLHEITELIKRVEYELIIISPWFDLYGHMKNEIIKALNRDVKIIVITREPTNEKHKNAIHFLKTRNSTILYNKNLHAKILMGDRWQVILGSANLQEKALMKNHELGVLSNDRYFNIEVARYIEHIGETMGVDILGIAQEKFPPSIFEKIRNKFFKQTQLEEDKSGEISIGKCPNCGGLLVERTSEHGKFIGCSNYPACKHLEKNKK